MRFRRACAVKVSPTKATPTSPSNAASPPIAPRDCVRSYVILDGIEVANSEGTSSLLFQSDAGDAIVLELCEKADGDDDVHRQFDDSDSADEGADAGAGVEELHEAATHMLVIRIKPTSDGIAYQYACSYDNEPLAETNSLATGGVAANYKISIPVSDVAQEESGGKVAWYRVDCQRVADEHSTSVCRRFSEFFDLNTDVASAFVGSPIERRLPTFPSRGIKLFGLALTDHYSSSFVKGRRGAFSHARDALPSCLHSCPRAHPRMYLFSPRTHTQRRSKHTWASSRRARQWTPTRSFCASSTWRTSSRSSR